MKLRHRWRPFCIGFVLLLPSLCAADFQTNKRLVSIEGRSFDVIGTDNRSASFANILAEHVAKTCRRYIKAGSHNFSQKILVTLYPEEHAGFEKSYQIRVSPRGQVSLDFCWNELLSFETACSALAEAYLLSYVRFNYGISADERIRFWPFSALVAQSYLSLRPAQRANYIRTVRKSEMPEIRTLLSLYFSDFSGKELNPNQGYWVFQILRESELAESQVAILLERALAGENVEPYLVKILFSKNKSQTGERLEEWWQNQVSSYLAQEHEFCDSLAISKSWMQEMADVSVYNALGGELRNLMDLWDYRADADLRTILSARCDIIRLRIMQVNPAYFNATLSLGALYETVLVAENKHEFIRAVSVYLNDWEDIKRLHSRVNELTSACD